METINYYKRTQLVRTLTTALIHQKKLKVSSNHEG